MFCLCSRKGLNLQGGKGLLLPAPSRQLQRSRQLRSLPAQAWRTDPTPPKRPAAVAWHAAACACQVRQATACKACQSRTERGVARPCLMPANSGAQKRKASVSFHLFHFMELSGSPAPSASTWCVTRGSGNCFGLTRARSRGRWISWCVALGCGAGLPVVTADFRCLHVCACVDAASQREGRGSVPFLFKIPASVGCPDLVCC